MSDAYLKMLKSDDVQAKSYYRKSLAKTEQQKFLENLLAKDGVDLNGCQVADIACGGATLTYHLLQGYPQAQFYALDYNPSALQVAAELFAGSPVKLLSGNIFQLPFADNSLDYVFCWQTLSWIDDADRCIAEIMRVLKPGGRLYASSLFNLDFDVDLYTKVVDHTRQSGAAGLTSNYYTYALPTVEKWLNNVSDFKVVPFVPEIDFHFEGRGMGSFTVDSARGKLQISGGLLMHWGVLIATK